jgi:uncharacterized protein RhaS with RHS repeats
VYYPEVTWYGWDGDRLATTQTETQRIQTIYLPGSFTPLVRVETQCAELVKAARRTLAEKFQQEANVTFLPELVALVDNMESELQRGELGDANRAWLAQCGLTPEQIQNQIEPEYTPERKSTCITATTGVCRWRWSARTGPLTGKRNMMRGEMCSVKITRTIWRSSSACRDSSSMKRRGCIITVTDIMTLNREGILRRIPLG